MRHRSKTLTVVFYMILIMLAAVALHADDKSPSKVKASAIKVEMVQSEGIKLPAEFQVALYENLIQQLKKNSGVAQILRDGDRNTKDTRDLVVIRSTITSFKEGSERKRQVTTVAGATSMTIHCQFRDSSGNVLLERDISGKVRFFGGNLKATYDFAKKAARVAHDNFSAI
jgi:Domain of unknown function (DUF4410)